jgi:hypothetical protein
MTFTVDNALALAVIGLVVKEGTSMILKFRKKGNGRDLNGMLSDIKGQGKLTLDKVNLIEVNMAKVTTEIDKFNKYCDKTDAKIGELDDRLFDHVRQGG